ncbi:hypothetical protein GCM10007278_07100 [Paenalcaligenes hominis]|nr:hypothetical protein GCM10007278_07100 [Paenalcaligenes hominis]
MLNKQGLTPIIGLILISTCVVIMYHQHSNDMLLTDDLERRLIQSAVEHQDRLRPLLMLKAWFKQLFA